MKDAILKVPGYGTEYSNRSALKRVVKQGVGAPGKAFHELRFIPEVDLAPQVLADAGVVAATEAAPISGQATLTPDGAVMTVYQPWQTGTFRHELGHCIFWSLALWDKAAVMQAWVDAGGRAKKAIESGKTFASEAALFATTGFPSMQAVENVDEFFAEIYRLYQIHALRSAKGSSKPGLSAFRAGSPMMAKIMDDRYSAAMGA